MVTKDILGANIKDKVLQRQRPKIKTVVWLEWVFKLKSMKSNISYEVHIQRQDPLI